MSRSTAFTDSRMEILSVRPVIRALEKHPDGRGCVLETYRASWFPGVPPVVQAVQSESRPRVQRAMHAHKIQWDIWHFVAGAAFVQLYDHRDGWYDCMTLRGGGDHRHPAGCVARLLHRRGLHAHLPPDAGVRRVGRIRVERRRPDMAWREALARPLAEPLRPRCDLAIASGVHRAMVTQHGLRCYRCRDRIFSNFRHDFVSCKCDAIFIDGGFDYVRAGFDPEIGPGEPIARQLARRPARRYRAK